VTHPGPAGWIAAHAAADRPGITTRHLRRLAAAGVLPALPTPYGRAYLAAAVEALAAVRAAEPRRRPERVA
jgi:hypothetical protein